MTRSTGFATRAIHHAYNPLENDGALTPPLHLTSTFTFETAEAGGEMFAGEREGHIYSRISNPTCDLLEQRIAVLEGAEAGLALSSGMGAITAVLWTLLSPGAEVIVDKTLYGCTFAFMRHGLAKWGVTITHVDMTDPENLESCRFRQNPRCLFRNSGQSEHALGGHLRKRRNCAFGRCNSRRR